jgi:predicted ATP-grasp superfamily ATP-dependent carboligase/thioesterase domain-containing protein
VARKVEGAAGAPGWDARRARGDAALNTAAFLNELLSRDIRVSADGERLRCNAPAGALTPELRDELTRRKAEILEFLRKAGEIARQPEGIVPIQPRGTRVPVYAVAGHNGDVFAFRDLVRHLGDDQPFYGLQAPGLDGQSEPLARVEDIAAYLAAQIRTFQPKGDFIIAGYCAGGGVALELARQLARAGAEPRLLALFGCAHPSVYRFNLRYWARRVALHVGIAATLPTFRARWQYLAERWRARLRELHVEKTSRFEQVALAAVRRYTPGPYAGRVCHFIPKKGWLPDEGGAARWRSAAPRIEEYYGPDNVDAERMLLDPDAAVFAELYKSCWNEKQAIFPRAAGRAFACVIGDLSMVRALGRDGIPVAVAASDPASKVKLSRYCTAEVRTPSWVEDPDAALAALVNWAAEQREAPVVFYQGDHDMVALSRGRGRLAPHLRCVLPPAELVEEVADKLRFAALAERERLPVPFTLTLRRGSAVAAELARWDRFPCVLKPCMRSPRFAQLAQNQKAMRIRDRSGMDAARAVIENQDTDFVIQEAIDGGEEYLESYHAYLRPGGELMGEFTGRKIRTSPRLYGFSTYVEITDDDEVRRLGRSILERIGFSGVAKLDFKRDPRSRRLYLLEINPRFNLWHHAGAAAGVSLPALVYRDCIEPGSARPAGRARAGVRWVDAHADWRAFEGSWPRWLAEMLTVDVNESFMLRDPLPALDDFLGILHRKFFKLLEARPRFRPAR